MTLPLFIIFTAQLSHEFRIHDLPNIRPLLLIVRVSHPLNNIIEVFIRQQPITIMRFRDHQIHVLDQLLLHFNRHVRMPLINQPIRTVAEVRRRQIVLVGDGLALHFHRQLQLSRRAGGDLKQDHPEGEHVCGGCRLQEAEVEEVTASACWVSAGTALFFRETVDTHQIFEEAGGQVVNFVRDVHLTGILDVGRVTEV